MKKTFAIFLIFNLFCFSVFSQTITSDAGMTVPDDRIRTDKETFASDEFRRGVQAYYKGAFNEAIVQFEKALSYMPNDNLILEWLGKAYYKTGVEGSALQYWQTANDNGYGGLLLQNKIEIVRERRVTGDSKDKLMRLSEAGSFPGEFNGQLIFSGPVSVLPNPNGTMYIATYNSNQIILMNQNGKVIDRITGPMNGFDRPSDIIRLKDGNILVSETFGDRLALLDKNAKFIKYIGKKGRQLGEVVGPLYLAQDDLERIYVTDSGNRRVDVFDKEGNALFFFGGKQNGFSGLKMPTGITVFEDKVFVVDSDLGTIYEFDTAGNFVGELIEKNTFEKPEALKIWNDKLIICDKNKVLAVDPYSGALFEYVRTGNAPSRVTTAVADVNQNVIVSDFTANEIYIMSKTQELVGGFFVQIEQIDSSKFPNVTLEIKVENRHRQPVVGLQEENFYLTENKRPVNKLKFLGSASNNTVADITLIIDRSSTSNLYKNEIETAVKEVAASMNNQGTLRVISAGAVPVTEYIVRPIGVENFTIDTLKNPTSKNVALDLAIRLATNDLINAEKKRSIILISAGDTKNYTFEKYNLAELTSYVNNNSVGFSFIQVMQNAVTDEVDYIINNTCGDLYYVFRPEGLKNIVSDILDIPQGVYQLSYTSLLQTNFGQAYLPVETEVYLLNRSGRDESGYFAPLQ